MPQVPLLSGRALYRSSGTAPLETQCPPGIFTPHVTADLIADFTTVQALISESTVLRDQSWMTKCLRLRRPSAMRMTRSTPRFVTDFECATKMHSCVRRRGQTEPLKLPPWLADLPDRCLCSFPHVQLLVVALESLQLGEQAQLL